MALVVEKQVVVEYQEENDYHYAKERLYYIGWIKRLGIVAVVVAIASIVLASIQLTTYVSFLSVSLVVAAVAFFLGAILSIVWANRASKTYRADAELFQPRINDRLTKAIFIAGLILAGAAAVVLVNLYVQQDYPADYIVAQNTNDETWNDQYEGRTENGLVKYSTAHYFFQGFFAGFFFFYFLLASRAAFRCLKWSNQAMSYLVFLGNVLLLAFGLGIIFFANYCFGYGDYPQLRAHFPVWNIRGIYIIGIAVSAISLIGFLVDHKSWRVGFFVLAFLLLVLLILLVNFTGYAYRHTRQTYEYYKGVNDIGSCIDRMKLVHSQDLEDYGCPAKYTPLDSCSSGNTDQKWEFTSNDNTGVEKHAPKEKKTVLPTVTRTTTNPDGTVVADRPDGSQVTVNPDGTTVTKQPDGTKTTTNSDGTTTTERKDGTATTTQNDGTATTANKDGSTVTQNKDGSTTTTDKDGTSTTRNPDGSTVVLQTDGTRIYTSNDGTVSTFTPDGIMSIRKPDGTLIVKQPDGTTTTRSPDGTTSTSSPDGTSSVTRPDGTTTTQEADGTQTTRNSDGSVVTKQKDGTTTTSKPDGTVVTQYTDGTTVTRKADDTTTTLYKNGTVVTKSANGKTVTTTNPDGTSTTKTSSLFYDDAQTVFISDYDNFYNGLRSLDSGDNGQACLNLRCCGLLGELYTQPFLSLANFGLAATLAGCLVSIGCYYFWYVTWVDSARNKKKDFIWLGVMGVLVIVFLGLQFGLDPAYVHEKLGANGQHV